MFHPGTRSTALARRAAVFALAALCTAAAAGAASAATLQINVPAKVKRGDKKGYTISVQGTFRKSETTSGRAFLISVIQFSPKPCAASAQAEARTKRPIQYYLAPGSDPKKGPVGVFEKNSPFTNNRAFTARTVGVRHVCAWLYPSFIADPSNTTRPITKADKRYRSTR